MNLLSRSDQQFLLQLSRQTLQLFLETRTKPETSIDSPLVNEKRGAFVTLHCRGRLRGCIGYVFPLYSLLQTIIDCSISAAVEDPRFEPVTPQELREIDVEISVLTPLEEVTDLESILVGRDGLMISQHGFRGLLLPQVATQYGWDRERFLAETCRKAGLPADAWKKGARIEKFSAQVFGEREMEQRQH
jgi:AmmeMemoRadiSam system protein A